MSRAKSRLELSNAQADLAREIDDYNELTLTSSMECLHGLPFRVIVNDVSAGDRVTDANEHFIDRYRLR